MQTFNANVFRRRVDKALETVRQILERTRRPVYAADASHCYTDKYVLSNTLVRLALSSTVQGLGVLGITAKDLGTLLEWSKGATVTLRLAAEEKCEFIKETVREQESATRTETAGHLGSLSFGSSSKTVTTIKEYVWKFEGNYKLVAFRGVGADPFDQIMIRGREYSREILTGSKSNPRHDHKIFPNCDVNVSWLLDHVNADRSIKFEIDREKDTCRTPRRNQDINDALAQMSNLLQWTLVARRFFFDQLFPVSQLGLGDKEKRLDFSGVNAEGVFVPVVPLFIDEPGAAEPGQVTLQATDVASLLSEQHRTLQLKATAVGSTFPSDPTGVVTGDEAHVCVCLAHIADVVSGLGEGVDYIEHMLRQQLYAAVGAQVTSADFAAFNRFHNRKLFRDNMQPLPFCYAVRRSPKHSPEGILSIEGSAGGMEGNVKEPVYTHVLGGKASAAMKFNINAATSVQFKGERYLHAWLMHTFSGQGAPDVELAAQARQLSSFIVLIGKIASADTFEPKHAMIVQNKDDFRVPLNLATLPTPKEFKDAVESLSPEQQEFCKAWRAMQLESTLFAVCVIQIKPLLERVLNLPPEALSKEIKLTQDLTELFIKYQIPADLLTAGTIQAAAPPTSEDGFEVVSPSAALDKVAEVKGHVAAMRELIEEEKKKQMTEAAETAVFQTLETGAFEMQDDAFCSFGGEVPQTREMAPQMAMCSAPMMLEASTIQFSAPQPARRSAPGGAGMLKAMFGRGSAPPPAPVVRSAAPAPPPSQQQQQQQPAPAMGGAPPPAQSVTAAVTPAPPKQAEIEKPGAFEKLGEGHGQGGEGGGESMPDYTTLPGQLDKRLEELDSSNAVRPTIITAGETWTKKAMASLMSKTATTTTLRTEELREERSKAFELLDALTRSGALVVEEAALHVVIGATHTFDKGLVDTVVEDNVNPVVQVERSSLIMASSIMQTPAAQLIKGEHVERVRALTPALFPVEALPSPSPQDI